MQTFSTDANQNTRPNPRLRGGEVYRARRGSGCLTKVLAFLLGPLLVCGVIYAIFPPAPLNIVVMGLDSRGNEGAVSRTDSIMLVGVNAPNRSLSLLSIPRDLFINVPNYGMQRINTVNVLAEMEEAGTGPDLLMESISNNFAVDVNRYVRLDFEGFKALIDAVGGVDINVENRVVDNAYPTENYGTISVVFEPGWQHMDGERALIYARTRHQDSDYGRADRQQQVLNALARKLIIPIYWVPAFATLNTYTETNVSILDVMFMAPTIVLNIGSIDRVVVGPPDYISPGPGYSVPNYEALRPWLDENFR